MKKKKALKRILSFMLAVLMTVSYIPEVAYAATGVNGGYVSAYDDDGITMPLTGDTGEVVISGNETGTEQSDSISDDAIEESGDEDESGESDDANINGDDENIGGDENSDGNEDEIIPSDDESISDDDVIDESVSDNSVSENTISENSISVNMIDLQPVGDPEYKVWVSCHFEGYQDDIQTGKGYLSIDDAFDAIIDGSDFDTNDVTGNVRRRYSITLYDNTVLGKDIVISAFDSNIESISIFDYKRTEYLDLDGHTITFNGYSQNNSYVTPADLMIQAKIVSNSDKRGAINVYNYAFLYIEYYNDIAGDVFELFNNVDIGCGTVFFFAKEDTDAKLQLNNTKLYAIDLKICSGTWEIDEIVANYVEVGGQRKYGTKIFNRATLKATTVSVSNCANFWDTTEITNYSFDGTYGGYTWVSYASSMDTDMINSDIHPTVTITNYESKNAKSDGQEVLFVADGCTLKGDTINISKGLLDNGGTVTYDEVKNICMYKGEPESSLSVSTCENITTMYLKPQSTLDVEESATIATLVLSTEYVDESNREDIVISRRADTKITINSLGKAAVDDGKTMLAFKTLAPNNANYLTLTGTSAGTELFELKTGTFPIERVKVVQPSDPAYSSCDVAVQIGTKITVSKKYFSVGVMDPFEDGVVYRSDRERTYLASFAKWSDAVAYIDSLNNTEGEYYIEILEDVNTCEQLTLPKNVKSFTICGPLSGDLINNNNNRPVLSFLGNISLVKTFYVENIILKPVALSGDSYVSNSGMTLALNGKFMVMSNAKFYGKIASVSGTGNSELIIQKDISDELIPAYDTLEVTGKISGISLWTTRYNVTAGDISVSTLHVTSNHGNVTIQSNSNISIGNLSTWGGVTLVTGPDESNKVSITGTVNDGVWSADGDLKDVMVIGEGTGTDTVQLNTGLLISVRSMYVENSGKTYADFPERALVTGSKAAASFFVVDYKYVDDDNHTVAYITQKSGNDIVVCPVVSEKAVMLYSVGWDGRKLLGSYDTLQEAINEIDKIAVKNNEYEIIIDAEMSDDVDEGGNGIVTDTSKNFTMPKATSLTSLTIKSSSKTQSATVYLYNALPTLTCDLTLENITLAPSIGTMSMNIGSYALVLNDVDWDTHKVFLTGITGASVSGTSSLTVKKTSDGYVPESFTINGNVSNIGKVNLENVSFIVHGTLNIGDLNHIGNKNTRVVGLAKVTTDNDGNITKVESSITINGQISGDTRLAIELSYLDNYSYRSIKDGGFPNYADYVKNSGLTIAKAPKADTSKLFCIVNAESFDEAPGVLIKKSGNIIYVDRDFIPYYLEYNVQVDEINSVNYSIPCLTFADAVTEINNINNKENNYTIRFNADADGFVNADNPEPFTMPAASKLAGLEITSYTGKQVTVFYGTKKGTSVAATSKLAFTVDTYISNVKFVDYEAYSNKDGDDDNYPNRSALNIALGGKNITFDNVIFEGRAVIIDGGRTGTIHICGTENENIKAFMAVRDTFDYGNAAEDDCYIIEGEIKNLAKIYLSEGSALLVKKYVSDTKGTVKDASLTVTNFYGNSNTIEVEGAVTLTDLFVDGDDQTIIKADKSFTISGTVNSSSEDNLVLIGRQQKDKKTPYLNIKGMVNDTGYPIGVGIMPFDTAYDTVLRPDTDAALSLLEASKSSADRFMAVTALEKTESNRFYVSATVEGFYPDAGNKGTGIVKEKSLIKAYKGSDIKVVLAYTDDVTVASDVTGDDVIGYYTNVNDAVSTINSLKDKTAEYAIILLGNDGNDKYNVTIPAKSNAAAISIQGHSGVKTLTLSKFAVSNDITLLNVTLDVAGAVSQTKNMTLSFAGNATLYGRAAVTLENIVNSGAGNSIEFTRTNKDVSQLKINGTVTNEDANQLNIKMMSGTAAAYTVTALDEIAKYTTKLLFTAPKVTQADVDVYINGTKLNEKYTGASLVVKAKDAFWYGGAAVQTDCITAIGYDDAEPVIYCLDLNQALAQAKAFGDTDAEYTIYVGDGGKTIEDVNILDAVKYSKIDMPATNTIGSVKITSFDYADMGMYPDYKKICIKYSGDIAGYVAAGGHFTIEGVDLYPVNATTGVATETGKITLNRNSNDKDGDVTLYLYDVAIKEGYLNQISGTKNVTYVELNRNITLKTGFSNIAGLTIDGSAQNATVIAGGASTIGVLALEGKNSGFVSIGAANIDYLFTDSNIAANGTGPWIGSAGAGKFKLNGYTFTENTKVLVRMLDTTDKALSYKNLVWADKTTDADNEGIYLYTDLICAPLADPASFMAYPYGADRKLDKDTDNGYESFDIVGFKNGNNIRMGLKEEMTITVESEEGYFTYARNYKEAVDSIDTWKTKTDYTITFLTAGGYVTTAPDKNGNYKEGAFVFPKASNADTLTIKGVYADNGTPDNYADDTYTTIRFTGAVKPTVNVIFDDVVLDCGKTGNAGWESAGEVAIDLGAASLDMGDAHILKKDATVDDNLRFTSIKGSKGNLTLNDSYVYVSDVINMGTMFVNGDVTIKSSATAIKSFTIGSIIGVNGDDKLIIDAPIATSPSLKITGFIKNLNEVKLIPIKKDGEGLRAYTTDELNALIVTGNETNAELGKKKIADIPKGSSSIVYVKSGTDEYPYIVTFEDAEHNQITESARSYKSGGFLYITCKPFVVEILGNNGCNSNFLSFADAVAEIDKIGDKTADYTITLLRDVGQEYGCTKPNDALTMPKNAANVNITDHENGYKIYTTSTSVTFNTDTNLMGSVQIVPVKQMNTYKWNGVTYYNYMIQNSYAINIGGNAALIINSGVQINNVNKISGGELDIWGYQDGENGFVGSSVSLVKDGSVSVKVLDMAYGSTLEVKGKGSVTVQSLATIRDSEIISQAGNIAMSKGCEIINSDVKTETGNVSMKDAIIRYSTILASNIAMTGDTELDDAELSATANKTVGQGKLTIVNLILTGGNSILECKQDKSGKSMLSITGIVSGDAEAEISLMYNNADRNNPSFVVPQSGTMFATAAKVDEPGEYFRISDNNNPKDGYGLIKSKNTFVYGKLPAV